MKPSMIGSADRRRQVRCLDHVSARTICASERSVKCGLLVARVAWDLDIHKERLRSRLRQAEVDQGSWPDLLAADERAQLTQLPSENAELRRANETLKTAGVFSTRRSTCPAPGRRGDQPPPLAASSSRSPHRRRPTPLGRTGAYGNYSREQTLTAHRAPIALRPARQETTEPCQMS